MKKIFLVLILAGTALSVSAQYFFPDFSDSTGKIKDTVKASPIQATTVVNEPQLPVDDSVRFTELHVNKP
jgi:hypothetical protein